MIGLGDFSIFFYDWFLVYKKQPLPRNTVRLLHPPETCKLSPRMIESWRESKFLLISKHFCSKFNPIYITILCLSAVNFLCPCQLFNAGFRDPTSSYTQSDTEPREPHLSLSLCRSSVGSPSVLLPGQPASSLSPLSMHNCYLLADKATKWHTGM